MNLNKPRKVLDIIACDGACNFMYRHKFTPHIIIGDMDSANLKAVHYFSGRGSKIFDDPDQYSNDLEKALKYAIRKKYKEILIAGFGGKRFDHTLNNLSVLKKFNRRAGITLYDETFVYNLIYRSIEFDYRIGEVVSLVPLPKASGVRTSGLKYTLSGGTLELGVREGGMNEANTKKVKINIVNGFLIVFRKQFMVIP
jgi:thiamine pyrophosphokinase